MFFVEKRDYPALLLGLVMDIKCLGGFMYRQETHKEREAREKPQVKTSAYHTLPVPDSMSPRQAQQVLHDSGWGGCADLINSIGKCFEYVVCCGCCSSNGEDDYN